MSNNSKLVLCGPSCSGKDTLARQIENVYGISRDITYTTRPPREGEVSGINYRFVSPDIFDEMAEEGEFAETISYEAQFGHCSYGSLCWDYSNKNSLIILTPEGVRQVEAKGFNLYKVFLSVPREERIRRGLIRADEETDENKRVLLKEELYRRADADERDFYGFIPDLTVDATLPVEEVAEIVYKAYKKALE